jgi:hypothetical protein
VQGFGGHGNEGTLAARVLRNIVRAKASGGGGQI